MAKSVKHVFILILAFQTEGLRLQYHLSQGKHVRCTDLTLFFFADTTKLYIPFQTFGDLHPAAYICIALLMLVHLSPLPSPLSPHGHTRSPSFFPSTPSRHRVKCTSALMSWWMTNDQEWAQREIYKNNSFSRVNGSLTKCKISLPDRLLLGPGLRSRGPSLKSGTVCFYFYF